MRIEILVDGEEPQIFPLNKNQLTIGSQESCDIVLTNGGLSRKHLAIITDEDKYFIVDQGSTNGTYLNEERLVPGRKTEFTSFFPVRLGSNVLVSLLSDEEASDLGFQEPSKPNIKNPLIASQISERDDVTRTISLKDLHKAKTDTLVKKRQQTIVKRRVTAPVKTKKDADKSRMFWVQLFCIALISGAIYYKFYLDEPEVEVVAPIIKQGRIVGLTKPMAPEHPLVDDADMLSNEKLMSMSNNLTCTTDEEIYFCKNLPSGTKAIQSGTKLVVFFDGTQFYKIATQYVKKTSMDESKWTEQVKSTYKEEVKFISSLMFFVQGFPKDFDASVFKGLNIFFVMSVEVAPDLTEVMNFSITGNSLSELLKDFSPDTFEFLKKFGQMGVTKFRTYYRIDKNEIVIPKESLKTL